MCASTGDGRAGGRGAARPSGALGRELAIGAPEGRDGAPTPALGYLFRHLATHPEHRRRLIDEPELIPSAVEEALHRCLGAHLARRELQPAVEEWPRVIPDFHVATAEELEERGGGAMMTLTNLPLAWEVPS